MFQISLGGNEQLSHCVTPVQASLPGAATAMQRAPPTTVRQQLCFMTHLNQSKFSNLCIYPLCATETQRVFIEVINFINHPETRVKLLCVVGVLT